MQDQQIKKSFENKNDKMLEQILVIPKKAIKHLLPNQGIRQTDTSSLKKLIEANAIFMSRGKAETDPIFKQIIPYLVFVYEKQLFLMQRSNKASESRLASKLSLGIGGHLQEKDMQETNLFDWAEREFMEEVEFTGNIEPQFIGIINDESNAVGQVHAGLFWLVKASSPNIKVKEELKSGKLVSLEYCKEQYKHLESWSQMIIDHLITIKF